MGPHHDGGFTSLGLSELRERIPPSTLSFSSIAASSLEKKAMMTLTCTEFDQFGEVKANSVKYLKTDLSARHGLETRDLRTVQPAFCTSAHTLDLSFFFCFVLQMDFFRNQIPTILVRVSVQKSFFPQLIHVFSQMFFGYHHLI